MTTPERGAPSSAGPAALLTERLRARAPDYYPELAPRSPRVRLLREDVRAVSVLYRFRLEAGEEAREVLVKVPLPAREPVAHAPAREGPRRPRLAVPMAPADRVGREFRSLVSIREHFDGLGDARFGTVRALDLLPEQQAFVMESVPGDSLRRLLYRAHRGRWRAPSRLEDAFHHAGAWLRTYHALRPRDRVEPRDTRREDHERFVEGTSRYLGARLGDPEFFERMSRALRAAARDTLPEALPLGLGHGDFAPRNILVGPESRVTVLDTVGRFLTPIYEDVGYFLVSLHHNWPQALSLGAAFPAARLDGYRRAFLSGYFGAEPVPAAAVRQYEMQAALDLWANVASRPDHARGARRVRELARLALLSRSLRRRITEEVRP